MSDVIDLEKLMRYSEWADSLLYDALRAVDLHVIATARPGRPQGIQGVLGHMVAVDRIWRGHLEGRDHGLRSRALGDLPPVVELHAAQAQSDRWYVGYVRATPRSKLEERVRFRFVDGGEGEMSRCEMLVHVTNHKTYHRGYVADMLYELGSRPPTMDLPVFLRDHWRPDPDPATTRVPPLTGL